MCGDMIKYSINYALHIICFLKNPCRGFAIYLQICFTVLPLASLTMFKPLTGPLTR